MVESRSSATTVRWALWSHDQMLGETILIATRISNSTAAQYLSIIGRPSMRSLLRDRQRIVLCRSGWGDSWSRKPTTPIKKTPTKNKTPAFARKQAQQADPDVRPHRGQVVFDRARLNRHKFQALAIINWVCKSSIRKRITGYSVERLVFEREAAAEYDLAFAHVTRYFMPFVLRTARIARL